MLCIASVNSSKTDAHTKAVKTEQNTNPPVGGISLIEFFFKSSPADLTIAALLLMSFVQRLNPCGRIVEHHRIASENWCITVLLACGSFLVEFCRIKQKLGIFGLMRIRNLVLMTFKFDLYMKFTLSTGNNKYLEYFSSNLFSASRHFFATWIKNSLPPNSSSINSINYTVLVLYIYIIPFELHK
jgi:hypothetical protein